MAEKVQRLALFETKAVVPLNTYPVGSFLQPLHVEGNSLLSTVFFKSGAGTVLVEYFETTTGEEFGEELYLDTHLPLSAFGNDKITISKIHNKPIVRVTITGAPVELGVYVSVISSFPVEFDFTGMSGSLSVTDSLSSPAVEGTISVGTTPVLLKVGGTNFSTRKFVMFEAPSNMRWGFSSAISPTVGYNARKGDIVRIAANNLRDVYLVSATTVSVFCSEVS